MHTEAFIGALIGLVAFFLIRFWFLVDEIRKDVKEVLIKGAARDEAMSHLKHEIDGLKADLHLVQIDIRKLQSAM